MSTPSNSLQYSSPHGGSRTPSEQIISSYQLHTSSPSSTDQFADEIRHNDEFNTDSNVYKISLEELLYSSSSYHAIVKPVTLTMVLAALAVVCINDEQTLQQGEQAMREAYTVWKTDESSQSNGETLVLSLGNALVMVSVICAMTFVIVLLYKLRCMKILIGYMIFSSATLLGVLGGSMFQVAIQIYEIPIDRITFYLFLYNFSVVGVMSIFWSRGAPTFVTQGYLIATSVILAWQLSHFDTWTTWTLLVMLALYDLCAVLTPCGPLKALVELMSQDDSPDMPGLLYEAELPPEAHRPGIPTQSSQSSVSDDDDSNPDITWYRSESEERELQNLVVQIPLAMALVYSLPVVESTHSNGAQTSSLPLLDVPENPTPQELRCMVTVKLPDSGGRIEPSGDGKTFIERDRFGVPKRTLWVDRQGKVFTELVENEDDESRNSIRLGLGDFIFYSVLVSKAAQYSFATFAACMLAILAGLGFTLILLAVYHHALPALPISIFFGVIFYILTRLAIEPWIENIFKLPFYV
mmetsp:Transcript_13523/g.19953  ORF Transcript_13523/g.19953 Transcript_13523/m.19953 type:complete len:524 (+) Transcript_13523:72-1643(+)